MRRSIVISVLCFVLGLVLGALLLFLTLTRGWLPNTRVTITTGTTDRSVNTIVTPPARQSDPPDTPAGNEALLARAMEVAGYLRDRDWSALAGAVHPDKGVRFTPYSSVSDGDMVFSPEETAAFGSDTRGYMWGYSDGPGEPMTMTANDYFNTFVFNADFTQAPLLAVNRVQVYGNAVENVADAYPEGSFVEFYYDGLDPANEGFDWCALKLVFEPYQGRLMLVGVIHSQWTI